jgi:hypothetical protein
MPDSPDRLYEVGGVSFIISGALFFAASGLGLLIGPPPSRGTEILVWMASQRLPLAFVPEILFFATGLLVPAVIALHKSLAGASRSSAAIGCGIIAVTIPVLFVLLIVHGRLSYPVYDIQVHTPEIAEFVVALYYGGMHAVALLFAIATFVLSLAMVHGAFGRNIVYLGFVTAAFDVMSGYPEAIGPIGALACGLFFAAWFVAVGLKVRTMKTSDEID